MDKIYTDLHKYLINLSNQIRKISILVLAVLLWCSSADAAPKPKEFPGDGYTANLQVTAVAGTNNHRLTWDAYTGFSAFGYDIYYGNAPSVPGGNSGRIETGAINGEWIDVDGKLNNHCESSDYYIVAYTRGRKAYSDPAQGIGPNICDAVDTTPPTVSITAPTNNQVYQGSQLITGTATDAGGSGVASVTVTLYDSSNGDATYNPTVENNEWLLNLSLPPGSYSIDVFASDTSGNLSQPLQVDFSVEDAPDDNIAPVLLISSPNPDEVFTSSTQTLTGTVIEEGSGVALVDLEIIGTDTLNARVPTTGNTWSLTTNLPNDSYTVTVDASDAAGNQAASVSRSFSVNSTVNIGADGYADTAACLPDNSPARVRVAPNSTPTFEDSFDSSNDIHNQLSVNWKSRYEWRTATSDVIINNEGQFYLDVLGFDAGVRNEWTPFEQLEDDEGNGYLAISAAKKDVLTTKPSVNGAALADQEYVSGVLTTFGKHSLSPTSGNPVTIELRARMPRGQGVFPAAWLYNESFFRNNPEIDIFEYVGQSPGPNDSWLRPSSSCGAPCQAAGRENYDTFHTQYHNYYKSEKGKLKGLSSTSVTNDGAPTGAVYTNPDSTTWWRGETWADCAIDFSEKFHIYTLEWSADSLVWYIDDIEVLRLDEQADSGGNLPGVNFVPVDTRPMYLTLNFALGTLDSYIGSPDTYTKNAMDAGELKYIIDYIKVWQ